MKASNGEIVATDGVQGYSAKSDAKTTLQRLMKGDYDGAISEAD